MEKCSRSTLLESVAHLVIEKYTSRQALGQRKKELGSPIAWVSEERPATLIVVQVILVERAVRGRRSGLELHKLHHIRVTISQAHNRLHEVHLACMQTFPQVKLGERAPIHKDSGLVDRIFVVHPFNLRVGGARACQLHQQVRSTVEKMERRLLPLVIGLMCIDKDSQIILLGSPRGGRNSVFSDRHCHIIPLVPDRKPTH